MWEKEKDTLEDAAFMDSDNSDKIPPVPQGLWVTEIVFPQQAGMETQLRNYAQWKKSIENRIPCTFESVAWNLFWL